jgi:hypothetical protein
VAPIERRSDFARFRATRKLKFQASKLLSPN